MGIPILIVDHDHLVSRMLARQLSCHDHHIVTACDCSEALTLAGRRDFAAIFVDCHLPDGSGLRMLPVLRQLQPDAVLVLTTCWSQAVLKPELSKMGLADCRLLPKPWTVDQVFSVIAAAAMTYVPSEDTTAAELACCERELEAR